MKKSGFSILEVMIYVTLALMIIIPVLRSCLYVCTSVYREYDRTFAYAQFTALLSIITREIQMAPQDYRLWKALKKDTLIWHTGDGDRGWVSVHDRLESVKGIFNSRQNTWHARHKGMRSELLEHIEFVPVIAHRGTQKIISLIRLTVKLRGSSRIFSRSIAPRSIKGGW